jgi:hypothetical protein
MGEVIRFVPKAELERLRLIREARAMYESVFPSTAPVNEQRHGTSIGRAVGDDTVHTGNDAKS